MTGPSEQPQLDGSALQARAIAGVSWTIIGTLVSLPVVVLVNILLAHVLGVHGYGRLAYLTAALEVTFALVDIGVSAALIQFGARAHAAGDTARVQELLSRTQGFRLLVVAPLLTVFVLVTLSVDATAMVLAVLLLVWVPTSLGGLNDCLTLENKGAAEAKLVLGVNLTGQTAVVITALATRSPDPTWIARLSVGALIPIAAIFLVDPRYRKAVIRPRVPTGFPAGFWRFALPTGLAGLVGGLVMSRSEVLLLQWLSTPTAVGVFALAIGIAGQLYAPAGALTGPLAPALAGLHAVAPDKLPPAFLRAVRVAAVFGTLSCLLFAVPVALLMPLIYGSGFEQAAPIMVVAAVLNAITMLSGPVSAFLYARQSGVRLAALSVAALVVDVVLALALIPVWDAWGAVLALAASKLTHLVLMTRLEGASLLLQPGQVLAAARSLLVAIVAVPALWWIANLLDTPPIPTAAIACVLGVIVGLGALRPLRAGLTPGDSATMLAHVPRATRPVVARINRWLVHAEG